MPKSTSAIVFHHIKALSTLATIVAEFGNNLSPNSATVASVDKA